MAKIEHRACDRCRKMICEGISFRGAMHHIVNGGTLGQRIPSHGDSLGFDTPYRTMPEHDFCKSCFCIVAGWKKEDEYTGPERGGPGDR